MQLVATWKLYSTEDVAGDARHIPSEIKTSHFHLQQWYNVVEEHSRWALINKDDKLPAISGLASLVQKVTGYKYLSGLWEEDIRRCLVWQRSPHDNWACYYGSP